MTGIYFTLLLSTLLLFSMQDITRRKKGTAERQVLRKPQMVCDYNKSMGGVDFVNQMIKYYPVM